MKLSFIISPIALAIFLYGCAGTSIDKLGKSDIDLVADIHINAIDENIQQLTMDLYDKNPEEFEKNITQDMEKILTQIIEHPTSIAYKETNYAKGVEAIELALSESYKGDRVFALMLGISGMIRLSYGNQRELFILDQLDPQKLYNSGVNLERIIQRIRVNKKDGRPLLKLGLRYGKNSFEDIMTRMISIQQMMAEVIAGKDDRILNKIMHGTATILIPIPL